MNDSGIVSIIRNCMVISLITNIHKNPIYVQFLQFDLLMSPSTNRMER